MNPHRVLIMGMSGNKGGIETFIIELYKSIDKSKVQFDFLTTHSSIAFEKEIGIMGGRVHKISSQRGNRLMLYKAYKDFFEKFPEYKVVHVNKTSLYSIEELIAMKSKKVPHIILHSHASKLSNNKIRSKLLHELNKRIVARFGTLFFSCSPQAYQYMFGKDIRDEKNNHVIPNAIDLKKFSFNSKTREIIRAELEIEEKLVIGHIGAFLPVKNHEFLLMVFSRILIKRPDSILLMVGDGPNKTDIEKKVKELGMEQSVKFLGMIDNVNEVIQGMDALVFPSKHEGFGNVIIEAQAAGLPCIISDVIPKSVKITNLVKQISLQSEPAFWANIVLKEVENLKSRSTKKNLLTEKGYSMDNLSKSMCALYIDLNSGGNNE